LPERQLPRRRADRGRDHRPRQAPLPRRAEAGRGGRLGPPPLPDLRVRAELRGRAGHRPLGDRAPAGLDHASPLRPHRPQGTRSASRGRPRGDAGRGRGAGPRDRTGRRRLSPRRNRGEVAEDVEAASRVIELRREIAYHDNRYYALDDPEIGDDAYDALMRELRELEEADPGLVTPDSPTQRVGGRPGDRFEPVRPTEPMLSLP